MKKIGDTLDEGKSKVCFVSSFPPKECGIATFTQDLVSSMNSRWNPRLKSRVIALNEHLRMYNYDNRVLMQVDKEDIENYIQIARQINKSDDIKIVCIQHEFGLFGGDYGSYLIPFLETIQKPIVTSFHSVLPNPDELRKKIVSFIAEKSSAIIVMANKAGEILKEDYGINEEKIHLVHHGIPNVQYCPNKLFKEKLRLEGKIVLSTFGLLSRGKGIEYMIKAMPKLVKKYPNLLYLIIGETHPVVREHEGESYRNKLLKLVEKLGLQNNVRFYNKYLTLQEITDYLLASDIYVCTNLEKNQITSGTLAYALGCGKAVVSTPIVYAEEMLDEERGILADFKNPKSYMRAVDKILSDKELKERLEKNAYSFGRSMTWQNVALQYLKIFNKIVNLREETTEKYPKITLNHLKRLSDNFGCLQFSKHSSPDKNSGYTVDDNARALIVSILHSNLTNSKLSLELSKNYLNLLEYAQNERGEFANVIKRGKVLNEKSEDAFGRAIWALGFAINKSKNKEIIEKAKKLFEKSIIHSKKLIYARSKAFSMLGISYYYKTYKDKNSFLRIKKLADSLVELYEKESSKGWEWFEDSLTYSNSKIPEALFLAYDVTKDRRYLKVAEKTFRFLSDLLFIDGKLSLVGQNGWCKRNGERAFFDQQPVDASSMVQTCLTAYKITRHKKYYKNAVLAFNWFLGRNHLEQMMYDESTGGCFDGLSRNSVNLNQGAESTISYLLARLMMEDFKINFHK